MLFGRKLRKARLAASLAAAIGLISATGLAQSTSDDLARRHFESGTAYLEESDYDNALKAFEKAYELSKRPEILLNIATVHERKSELPAAITALKSYLEVAPQGEHAETVKLRIQNLEKRLEKQSAQPPPAAAAPPPPPAPAKAAPPTPPPAPVPAAPAKPEPNRLPAFIALGVGGVLAGGAVATGIVAKSKYDDLGTTCKPRCTDDQLSSSRGWAITSTVLTGAAALGVGLGVALLLTGEHDDSSVGSARPRVDVALGPSAAAASAAWSF